MTKSPSKAVGEGPRHGLRPTPVAGRFKSSCGLVPFIPQPLKETSTPTFLGPCPLPTASLLQRDTPSFGGGGVPISRRLAQWLSISHCWKTWLQFLAPSSLSPRPHHPAASSVLCARTRMMLFRATQINQENLPSQRAHSIPLTPFSPPAREAPQAPGIRVRGLWGYIPRQVLCQAWCWPPIKKKRFLKLFILFECQTL